MLYKVACRSKRLNVWKATICRHKCFPLRQARKIASSGSSESHESVSRFLHSTMRMHEGYCVLSSHACFSHFSVVHFIGSKLVDHSEMDSIRNSICSGRAYRADSRFRLTRWWRLTKGTRRFARLFTFLIYFQSTTCLNLFAKRC